MTLSEEDLQNIEESIDGFANMSAHRKQLGKLTDKRESSRRRRKAFLYRTRTENISKEKLALQKRRQRASLTAIHSAKIRQQNAQAHRHSRLRHAEQFQQFQQSLINSQQASAYFAPTLQFLNMRERNCMAAQMRFALGSGFNAHNDIFMKPTVLDLDTGNLVLDESDIESMTNTEPLTTQELMACMNQFMATTDSGQPIGACASCGVTSLQFTKEFQILELYGEPVHSGKTLSEIFQIVDDFSNPVHVIQLQSYISGPYHTIRTFAKINSVLYHLHADLIIYNKQHVPITSVMVPLCRHCVQDVSKGSVPRYNVKFCDFGNLVEYQKIVLGREGSILSLAERSVAARSIVFETIVKYSGNEQPFHKGHCVTLAHDGAVAMDNVLPRSEPKLITKLISAAFVGKKQDYDKHQKSSDARKQFLRNLPLLHVDARRVASFLRFKVAMDTYYHDVTLRSLNDQLISELESIPESILSNALLCDGEQEQRLDASIHDSVYSAVDRINDDVSEDFEIQSRDTTVASLETDMENNVELESVFIAKTIDSSRVSESRLFQALNRQCFHPEQTSNGAINTSFQAQEQMSSVFNMQNGEQNVHCSTNLEVSSQDRANEPTRIQIPIAVDPINEYTNNRDILIGSFPDLFLLGQGILTHGSLRQRDINHLLLQYDCRFSQNPQFLFLLFNQQRRHATAANVNVKVKGGSESVKAFQEMVNTTGFKERLQDAIAHPETTDAKNLARSLNRITSIVGGMVPWTQERRQYAKYKLMALVSYSGPFSYFVTISLADMDSTIALRISNSVVCANDSNVSGTLFNNDNRSANLNFVLPSWKQRNAALARDPVAYARVYKLVLESFLIYLVGRSPEYLQRSDPRCTGDSTEYRGIFGSVYTYGFVTEEQKRGSAHTHGVITCDLSPISFQKYIGDPRVLSKLCARVDSIVQAYISDWERAQQLSKVVSTFPTGCQDKETASQRDTRYLPTESHSDISIELSNAREDINMKNILSNKIEQPDIISASQDDVVFETMSSDRLESSMTVSTSDNTDDSAAQIIRNAMSSASECARSVLSPSSTDDDSDKFEFLMKRQMAVVFKNNVHQHSFTCHKSAAGKKRCRMCYPRASCNRTTNLVEIEFDETTGRPRSRTKFNVKISSPDPLIDTNDDRVIVLELFRPSDDYVAENTSQYETAAEETKYWVECDLGKNSNVVSFSPSLSAMFASNSNVEILGNWAQSKNATYYIIKYMVKDDGSVQTILPVLLAAHRKVSAKPSIAQDSGSESRNAKHVLNVLLNTLNGKTEVGGQTAALSLLGLPSEIFSHDFAFVYPWPTINFLTHLPPSMLNESLQEHQLAPVELEQSSADTETTASNRDISYDRFPSITSYNIDVDLNLGGDDSNAVIADENMDSGVREIVVGVSERAEVQTVAQFENYFHRLTLNDRRLENMTLYEWVANIKVCKFSQNRLNTQNAGLTDETQRLISEDSNEGMNENDDETIETGHAFSAESSRSPGRPKNDTFRFNKDHKISGTHCQRIRSKTVIPMLAGRSPPPHPGPRQDNAVWKRKADCFAAYYLTLHRPFSFLVPLTDLTYNALSEYVKFLEASSDYMDKARLHWIKIGTHGLSIKATQMKLLSSYRGRMTHYWNGDADGVQNTDEAIECSPFDLEQQSENIGEDLLNRLHQMYNSFSLEVDDERIELNQQIQDSIDHLKVLDMPETIVHSADSTDMHDADPRFDVDGEDGLRSHLNIFKNIKSNKQDADTAVLLQRNELEVVEANDNNHSLISPILNSAENSFHMVSIEDDLMLNSDQQKVFKHCLRWYNDYSEYLRDPYHNVAPPPFLTLILGAAGTGKSFFVSRLIQRINKPGSVRCAAPTGVAATNLNDSAYTCHSLFAMPWDDQGGNAPKKSAGTSRVQEAKLNLGSEVRIIIIDEFSMLSEQQFCLIDQRLRSWTEKDAHFGGIGVILMGDPFQIPPVMGKSLIKAATEINNKAGFIFSLFSPFQFQIQQRASKDEAHSNRLNFFRRPVEGSMPILESGILNTLKELKHTDVIEDQGWKDAVIIVGGNEQRIHLNLSRARAFAKRTGQPIIAFRLPLKSASIQQLDVIAESLGVTSNDLLKDENETIFYFVKGAPVVITDNINILHHIANGTRGRLDSITLHPTTSDEEWANINLCHPGDIYWLSSGEYPVSVNIIFDHISIETWNSQWSLKLDTVVAPFPLCPDSGARMAKTCQLKKAQIFIRSFYCDLAFAVTFHKVQGRTEDKVIIDFNPLGKKSKICDLAAFYVAVSRVRSSSDIRVLPIKPETKKKLEKHKFSRHLIDWYASKNLHQWLEPFSFSS